MNRLTVNGDPNDSSDIHFVFIGRLKIILDQSILSKFEFVRAHEMLSSIFPNELRTLLSRRRGTQSIFDVSIHISPTDDEALVDSW